MHDPKVVAFDVPRPWPRVRRRTWHKNPPRWEFRFKHVPKWQFWRGWKGFWIVAGWEWYWPAIVTVWHEEPGGRDALTVCQRRVQRADGSWTLKGRWQWHVHHWRIQIAPVQKLHRLLFERCEECGRRYPWGYGPVAHQWDQPRGPWWRVTRRAYHHECSSLVSVRQMVSQDTELVHKLINEIRVRADETEAETIDRLTHHSSKLGEFYLRHRLQRLMGYDRDDDYELVKQENGEGDG